MNIFSVLLRKEHARSPRTSLSQCWICPWQKRDFHQRSAPALSSRRTLIQLHYFSASYAATKLSTFLASLASWITSVAVTHLQSLSTGLWPGNTDVEKTDTKTSPVSPKCHRGSSFVVGNMCVFVS
ncbi:uncharacterized protein LOC124208741 [Daphnia pulex]|uniref:uncharacterized protein LOC124208741 n=1 Tax=Daphnia pulex TaxID=6669 RepID=UPI001EDEA906|nr:uncharacterized protein LOC124208741 [Daphnia pulex]